MVVRKVSATIPLVLILHASHLTQSQSIILFAYTFSAVDGSACVRCARSESAANSESLAKCSVSFFAKHTSCFWDKQAANAFLNAPVLRRFAATSFPISFNWLYRNTCPTETSRVFSKHVFSQPLSEVLSACFQLFFLRGFAFYERLSFFTQQ